MCFACVLHKFTYAAHMLHIWITYVSQRHLACQSGMSHMCFTYVLRRGPLGCVYAPGYIKYFLLGRAAGLQGAHAFWTLSIFPGVGTQQGAGFPIPSPIFSMRKERLREKGKRTCSKFRTNGRAPCETMTRHNGHAVFPAVVSMSMGLSTGSWSDSCNDSKSWNFPRDREAGVEANLTKFLVLSSTREGAAWVFEFWQIQPGFLPRKCRQGAARQSEGGMFFLAPASHGAMVKVFYMLGKAHGLC